MIWRPFAQQINLPLLGALVVMYVATALLLLPYCDLIYQCGCKLPWQGAADFCNINTAEAPHCPWCKPRNLILSAGPFVVIFIGQGLAATYLHRQQRGFVVQLIAGMVVFLVLGALNGLIFKALDNYPYYFTR